MNWTDIYRHAVGDIEVVFIKAAPPEGNVKPCQIIPCPGSYFPAHDEQCEMVREEDFVNTDCQCEPRARERSWPTTS